MPSRYAAWLPRETLAQKIARLRDGRKWTTREFQAKSGVSASTISRVERGHEVTLSNLVAIAKAFNMTVQELLEGIDFD